MPMGCLRTAGPVLLADDDEDIRLTLSMVLEEEGFAVTLAADGSEATAAAVGHFHPVAVLDVSMPNLDGIQAARELRRSHPGMWIVMHSSWEEQHVRSQFDGYDAFFRKPTMTVELVRSIRLFLANGPRP